MQTCCGPIVERMGKRNFRLNPSETESREWKRFEKGGTGGEWVNGRTNIMDKSRQRQLGRARAAADGGVGFQHENRMSGAGEGDRGGETVRP